MPKNDVPLMLRLTRVFFHAMGTVAPVATGRIAARMFLRPRRHHPPRRERQWLRDSERRDFDVADHTIATYAWGEGPVVLLIHGWEGRGSQMGAFAAPLVEAGYRAVAVDLPAHGNSSGELTDGFTCGRAVRELCEQIGVVHGAVAHSLGGTAILLALAGGVRVARLALIAPGVKSEAFFEGFARIVGLPPRATTELRRNIAGRFPDGDWSLFSTEKMGPVLESQAGAVLVANDTGDIEVPLAHSAELVEHARNARLLTTTGRGHRRILRDPAVVREITSFITDG